MKLAALAVQSSHLEGAMIKKILFTCLIVFLFSSFANATMITWTANPTAEKIYQYTLYYYNRADPTNVVAINTTTPGVSVNGSLIQNQAYVFYATAWNRNSLGTPVESPNSIPLSYTIPIPVEDAEPDRPTGISLKLLGVPPKPFIISSPCDQVEVFKIYVNTKPVKEYSPMTDDSLAVDVKQLVTTGVFKMKISAENSIGTSDPIEFTLTISEQRRKIRYEINIIPKFSRLDPTYLSAFDLDHLVLEIPK